MSEAYFEIDGQKSTEFGLQIAAEISFNSPEVKSEFVDIDGQDGELLLTNGNLRNVPKSFPVFLNRISGKTYVQQITEISNWLKSKTGWKELTFSGDPNYIYQATITDEYSLDLTLEDSGRGVVSFICKPYKFLKTGLTEQTLGASIENPTKRPSNPRLKIRGSGNITISIGNATWSLRGLESGIMIDTLTQTVTSLDGARPAWDKITTYPLPTIAPGRQNVLVTGTVTDIKIIPRWEVIVG